MLHDTLYGLVENKHFLGDLAANMERRLED